MPLVRSASELPQWCELRRYDSFEIGAEGTVRIPVTHPRARLLVVDGTCLVSSGRQRSVLWAPQFVDIEPGHDAFEARGIYGDCRFFVFQGHWGEEVGGCGLFSYSASTPRKYVSDPVDYPKSTNFDSHYHDCDEYWFFLDGKAEVVVGKNHYQAGPSDCVVIGAGHHHDIPAITDPVWAIAFLTTLQGRRRLGHLWNHTHGQADPQPERV